MGIQASQGKDAPGALSWLVVALQKSSLKGPRGGTSRVSGAPPASTWLTLGVLSAVYAGKVHFKGGGRENVLEW